MSIAVGAEIALKYAVKISKISWRTRAEIMAGKKAAQKIVVLGSINTDLVVTTSRLPLPGETLMGQEFFTVPGGKGANQAVACGKLGIPTQLIGRVGGDEFGRSLLANLQEAGIETTGVTIDPHTSSGVAAIVVATGGENQIIVIPGANGRIDTAELAQLEKLFPTAALLLLQLEIPLGIVIAAAQAAHRAGVPVILDPAPLTLGFPPELYPLIEIITPNQGEASQLVGFPVTDRASATRAAQELLRRGVKNAVVKLGGEGAVCATPEDCFFLPAFAVEVVDTVAAGDAFNGGLTAGLISGLSLAESLVWAAAAGAIATTKPGAQSSLSDRLTLNDFLTARGVTKLLS